jgi:Flp pilus assembly protein TadG
MVRGSLQGNGYPFSSGLFRKSTKMRLLKKFFKDVRGGVAITFGLAAVPMVMAMGIALEYSQSTLLKAKMQAAGDNAGLAAAASDAQSDSALTEVVRRYVRKNNPFGSRVSSYEAKAHKLEDGRIEIKLKANMRTSMLRIMGRDSLKVSATTIITRDFGNLDVALVLDNTGSMAGRKMSTLKNAAAELVNTLHDAKGDDSEVKIGLVPFAQYVNIGMSNRHKSWANVPNDSVRRIRRTRWRRRVISRYNCHRVRRYYYSDGVRRSYTYTRCQYRYGPRYRQTYWQTIRQTWRGCVGSRNYPWNTRDERATLKIPGLMNTWCSRALTEMTDDKDKILSEIRRMNASGATYVPGGLMWGWRVVSEAEPFANKSGGSHDDDDDDKHGFSLNGSKSSQKAIVLMTDGENTVSPSYPYHWGSNQTTSDRLTSEICENIKASNEKITVYTVAFEVNDVRTKQMLRSCATSPSHFFDASNSAALTASFQKIAKSLASLRIAQ